MAEQVKIKPPYAPAIKKALKEGMTYEMIDSAIGWKTGRSKIFYEEYLNLCKELDLKKQEGEK